MWRNSGICYKPNKTWGIDKESKINVRSDGRSITREMRWGEIGKTSRDAIEKESWDNDDRDHTAEEEDFRRRVHVGLDGSEHTV